MIPLRLEQKSRRLPLITWLLVAANVVVFGYQISLGAALPPFMDEFSLVPFRLITRQNPHHWLYAYPYRMLVTSIFLHGGLLHLVGNMLSLWVFGPAVEDRLGSGRYLFFYLLAGVVSGVGHVLAQPHSTIPCVGASGAIAGILGAALVLHPRAWVVTLVPFIVIFRVIRIPAVFFLLLWFAGQLLLAHSMGQPGQPENNIAVMAHIVGFAFGAVAALFLRLK